MQLIIVIVLAEGNKLLIMDSTNHLHYFLSEVTGFYNALRLPPSIKNGLHEIA